MDKLTYAAIVIMIIWAGIFAFLLTLDRRLRRLEKAMPTTALPPGAQETPPAAEREEASE